MNHFDIYSYPADFFKNKDKEFLNQIRRGHDKGTSIEHDQELIPKNQQTTCLFTLDCPVPQLIDDQNIYTISLNSKIIIGLIFEKQDNPYDYREIFEDLTDELLNNEKCCSFEDEIEIENFLITLFIDIRRYGDEFIEKMPISFKPPGIFTKVFLFGIEEVGKSSLIRRLKTGQFDDNYYAPTRKFNIEYIQKEKGGLAIWDMPGQKPFRGKWLKGVQDSNLLIYMIDVANQVRFNEAKEEMWAMLNEDDLIGIPLIILGNKVDLIEPSKDYDNCEQFARIRKEIHEFFELDRIRDRDWKFIFTSVKTNYMIDKLVKSIFVLTFE